MKSATHRNDRWLHDLVSEVGSDVLRFLRRRLSHGDQAQDLAQEVFLRLMRVEDVGLIRNPRAYTTRVAAHVAHEWRMLARNRMPHSEEALTELIDEECPAEAAQRTQEMEKLEQILGTLTPKCRTVLLMNRRDGMTYQEIAAELSISVAMVKKYLAKGLAACQKHAQEQRETE